MHQAGIHTNPGGPTTNSAKIGKVCQPSVSSAGSSEEWSYFLTRWVTTKRLTKSLTKTLSSNCWSIVKKTYAKISLGLLEAVWPTSLKTKFFQPSRDWLRREHHGGEGFISWDATRQQWGHPFIWYLHQGKSNSMQILAELISMWRRGQKYNLFSHFESTCIAHFVNFYWNKTFLLFLHAVGVYLHFY